MLLNLQGWSPGEAELVTCFCNPGQMPFCLPDSFHMQCASFLLSGCWFIGGGDFDGGFCVCCFCLVIFFSYLFCQEAIPCRISASVRYPAQKGPI